MSSVDKSFEVLTNIAAVGVMMSQMEEGPAKDAVLEKLIEKDGPAAIQAFVDLARGFFRNLERIADAVEVLAQPPGR